MTTQRMPRLSAQAGRYLVPTLAAFSFAATAAVAQEMPVYEGVDDLPAINLRHTEPYAQDSEGGRATMAFADYVKEASKGKITMEVFWNGSLMGANEAAEGIASGLADSGTVAPIYDPASFPVANWLTALGNRASHDLPLGIEALDATHWEFSLTTPELINEFNERGLHMVGASSTFAFDMLCTSPIKSLADFKGKRARAAGQVYSKEAEALGMVPVPLIPAEMYEAFQRGIVDCVILHPPGYNVFGMMSIPKDKYFVNIDFSAFNSQYFSINKDKWDAMPPVAQQIIRDGYMRLRKANLEGLVRDMDKFGKQVEAGDATPVEADKEVWDALDAHQAKATEEMIANPPPGVTDPKALVERYDALLAKWKGILENEVGWAPKPVDIATRIQSWKDGVDFSPFLDRLREELLKNAL